MRPKLLEIEGLQSFCDSQSVDFTSLGETGLFGIFGPTGSGKSTILDAITLALYGDVKRARSGTQGIINTSRKTVRVSFSFELLKNGIRRNYRVERVYQRKKGSENACEAKIARLIEISEKGEIPLCDKANDVTGKIQELLGLSQADFTRAVVLPQNSFQEFLMLSNSERRGMLERIFYLEEYGRELLEKLSFRMNALNNRIINLEGELKGYEDASAEALEKARNAACEAAAEKDSALEEFKRKEAMYAEAKVVWELIQDLSFANDKELRHLSLKEGIAAKKAALARAVNAEGLLEHIRNNKDLNIKLAETINGLEEAKTSLVPLAERLDELYRSYEMLKNEIASEQPKLVERKARLQDAIVVLADINTLSKRINGLDTEARELRRRIIAEDAQLQARAGEFKKLAESLSGLKAEADAIKIPPEYRKQIQAGEKLESEVAARKRTLEETQRDSEQLRKGLASVELALSQIHALIDAERDTITRTEEEKEKHCAGKPGDKKELQNKMEHIRTLQSSCKVLYLRKSELNETEKKITKYDSELQAAILKSKMLCISREAAAARLEDRSSEFEKDQNEFNKNAALALSMGLEEGEPCPVCGSLHHPKTFFSGKIADASALEGHLAIAREELSQAESALNKADLESVAADEQLKSLTEQSSLAKREYDRKALDYSSDKGKYPETLRDLEPESIQHELELMAKSLAETIDALEIWENEQQELKQRLQELNDSLSRLRISENGKAAELKVNMDNLGIMEGKLAESRKRYDETLHQYSAFLEEYKIKSASGEMARLSESDRHLEELQKRITEAEKAADNVKALSESNREALQRLNTESARAEAELSHVRGQKESLEAGIAKLTGDVPVETEIKQTEDRLKGYNDREILARESIRLMEKKINELQASIADFESRKTIYEGSLKKDGPRLDAILAERGFLSAEEAEGSILPHDEQEVLKLEIEAYDQEGININAQKAMIRKKLDSREISGEEWNRISEAYVEIAAMRDQSVAKSVIASERYSETKQKNVRWIEITGELENLAHKQGLFEQIRKLLGAGKGSFIDYIAEERLRYIAVRASETLGVMTRYKYALELDTENGFIIRDNANGGVHRMVSSLSGGETFLTSLSLALALSEQIQLKGQSPLEFFFLDEGFGTLDNDLLDSVMDALERLSRSDRVIGLISHVPELRVRLGRRLIVDPPTAQGEGSRVRVEKA